MAFELPSIFLIRFNFPRSDLNVKSDTDYFGAIEKQRYTNESSGQKVATPARKNSQLGVR
jgi:hypothetical protein